MNEPSCVWCGEPVTPDERRGAEIHFDGGAIHYECGLRSAVGSVGHQQRLCSCYGGTAEDPPGLSRREAARAACRLFHSGEGS